MIPLPIPLLLAVLAALAPVMAMVSERVLGFAPCTLCLWQRWPYWVAMVLALLAAAWPRGRRGLLALAGIAVLASGAIAALHVGVEQGWWPSPLASCTAPVSTGGGTIDDLLASMAVRPDKPCDAAAYPIPYLPLSFAAMNLIYALALGGFTLICLRRRPA
ncbi:thiol:disulfide interchange protein DsbB [Humitalea rosea]|uniref:Thiol:disulfide interchange protein DsbB n=1 Tax=Humitalea rosea TaxID=990373 RepID=A0A2W7IY68_9PROT|nr:disulfide bond formation protein B [Humitalea rosea]PZW51145.1 thiol:disulfide interchange protein DsbB [Humitalea rosea]